MSMAGYTKLFNSILASTIWEADMPTRIVWITLLAMADKNGVAEGSIPGLATFARVTQKDCRKALAALQAPDPDSRSKEQDGRRIEAVDGGWRLVNHAKYRAKLGDDERREYLRLKQAEYRKKTAKSINVNNVSHKSTVLTHTEAEAKADTKAQARKTGPSPDESPDARSKRPIFKGVRFVVFEWMLDDLRRLLGAGVDAFDLHAWFFELDARAVADEVTVPQRDGGKWLQEQTLAEVERRAAALRPPDVDWWDECKQMHGGKCEERMRHHLQKQIDADRNAVVKARERGEVA